jgi:hypothetical protein
MKFTLMIWVVLSFAVTGCGHKSGAAENVASLEDLNRALPVVTMHTRVYPPSTNEMAKFLAVSGKKMPVPPTGKKLEIDPTSHQYVFVDQ